MGSHRCYCPLWNSQVFGWIGGGSVLPGGRWFGWCTVFEAGAGGEAVSLPVAGVLAVVAATLGAGVDPDGLARRNHLAARAVDVAVGTWVETGNSEASVNAAEQISTNEHLGAGDAQHPPPPFACKGGHDLRVVPT